jgi:hypothetical protein
MNNSYVKRWRSGLSSLYPAYQRSDKLAPYGPRREYQALLNIKCIFVNKAPSKGGQQKNCGMVVLYANNALMCMVFVHFPRPYLIRE